MAGAQTWPPFDRHRPQPSQLLFISRAWVLLLGEPCVPVSSPASRVSLWLSLSLPFLVTCRPSPAWMDQGVCVVNGMMPFLWRALTNSFSYSCPISTPGGSALLFKTICKNVQIKVEIEHKGEGLETK